MGATAVEVRQRQIDAAMPRYQIVLQLRDQNKSYREIGETLGVTGARARHLCLRAAELRHEAQRNTPDVFRLDTPTTSLPIAYEPYEEMRKRGLHSVADLLPFDEEMRYQLIRCGLGLRNIDEVQLLFVQHGLIDPAGRV